MPISVEDVVWDLLASKSAMELQEKISSIPLATLAQVLDKMWEVLDEVVVKYGEFRDKVPQSELERRFREREGKIWVKTYYYLLEEYSHLIRPTIAKIRISKRVKLRATSEYMLYRGADIMAGVYIYGVQVMLIPLHLYTIPQVMDLPLPLPRHTRQIIAKYFGKEGIVVPEDVLGIEVSTPIGVIQYP